MNDDKPKRGRPRLTDEEKARRKKEKNVTITSEAAALVIEAREKASAELGMRVTTSALISLVFNHWNKTHKGFRPLVEYENN